MRLTRTIAYLSLLLTIHCFSSNGVQASEKNSVPALDAKQIGTLSFNRLQLLRTTYIQFLKEIETNPPLTHSSHWIEFISSAYALGPDKGVCFFGGWQSSISNGKCAIPADEVSKNHCGSGQFECNPGLFPSSGSSGTGACVSPSAGYAGLTTACEKSSTGAIPDLNAKLDKDQMASLSSQVKTFCDDNPSYDACGALAERIKDITGTSIGNYNNPVPATGAKKSTLPSDKTKTATCGDEILNACNKVISNEGFDPNNASIKNLAQGCSAGVYPNLNTKKDLDALVAGQEKIDALNSTVANGLKYNLEAILTNETLFAKPPIDSIKSLDTFKNYIKGKYPNLAKNPNFDQSVSDAYQKIDSRVPGKLGPLDQQGVADQLNNAAAPVNKLCKAIHDDYVSHYPDEGLIHNFWNKYIHSGDKKKQLYSQWKNQVDAALNSFSNSTVASAMLATDSFKHNVFDPSVDFGKECALDSSYMPIKAPIGKTEVSKGLADLRTMSEKDLAKMNDQQEKLNGKDSGDVDDVMNNYIKNDPSLLYTTMKNMDGEHQKKMAAMMCSASIDVLKSDRNWKIADRIGSGVMGVAGVALLCTGVGSPVGAYLVGASLAGGAYELGRAAQTYNAAADLDDASSTRMAEQRSPFSDFTQNQASANSSKNGAYTRGGLAVVGILPGLKFLKSAAPVTEVAEAPLALNPATSKSLVVVAESQTGSTLTTVKNTATSTELAVSQNSRSITAAGKAMDVTETATGVAGKFEAPANMTAEAFSSKSGTLAGKIREAARFVKQVNGSAEGAAKWSSHLKDRSQDIMNMMKELGGRQNFINYLKSIGESDWKEIDATLSALPQS